MRRYNVHEAPRAILAHELGELIRREEHLNPDRPDRAESYRRALTELEMGAPAATARRSEFRINEDCSSRYGVTEGTRAEILAELEEYRADREGDAKAELYRMAILEIEADAGKVRVERISYRVIGE
jgi:hypothetical protein